MRDRVVAALLVGLALFGMLPFGIRDFDKEFVALFLLGVTAWGYLLGWLLRDEKEWRNTK